MSRLKLYWPDVRRHQQAAGEDSPANLTVERAVIPFRRRTPQVGNSQPSNALGRAQMIFANSRCPTCRHPVVQPLELNDAAVGRSNLPVPGTATLVGFRCEHCDTEWPA